MTRKGLPRHDGRLYCFSPPVMLATFLIEITLAAFLFLRYRASRFGKAAGSVLVLLALFQFAEYRICTDPGAPHIVWSRIGFAAITLLPVSGLYLVSLVSRKQHFLKLGYATAIGFAVYFLFVPKAISEAICGGNYVIFNGSTDFYRLYGFYYLGFLLLGIWEALDTMDSARHHKVRHVLQWLIIGYLSFMAPMGAAYIFIPITRSAVASIMCGFAVALAVILAVKVVPAYEKLRRPVT